jgi:transposase
VDAHKKSWKVNLRFKEMDLKTFSQNPSSTELVRHLKSNYPGANYRVVYEAGFCGFHFQRDMENQGVNCIVVHPADVPTTDKEKKSKTDTVDCRKLSKSLSEGSLKAIHIPSVEQQEDRGIIRLYQQMIKDQTRTKNRIKSWLNFQGIDIPEAHKHWSNKFIQWLKQISLSQSARVHLDLLIEANHQSRQLVLAATKQVRILSRQERHQQMIKLLRSIPGVGAITALLLLTEIGDINRFKDLDALCDYFGLVPCTVSSGDKEVVMGLTHRGHRQLREKLIEASWVAIRLDPALTMSFQDYCKRMEKNKAIIKIARKMLNRIRFVMKNKKEYVTAVVE